MIQFDPIENLPLTKSQPDPAGVITADNGVGEAGTSSAGLFAGIGQIFANLFNYFQQKKLQKQQQEFQKEFFDYTQSAQNAEYWKRVEYDTPFRQMQRLKDAGLNMNLMYGTLGNASGLSGNAPATTAGGLTGQMPTALPYFDTSSVIQSLFQPQQIMSMIGLNNSQSYKNYRSAGLDRVQSERLALLTPNEVMKYEAEIDYLDAQFAKLKEETRSLNIDANVKERSQGILMAIQEEQLNYLRSQVFATKQKGNYDAKQALRMQAEIEHIIPALKNMYNASAAEKWNIANQIDKSLDSYLSDLAAKADVSRQQAESYFWREVLPHYLDLGIDVTKLLINKGFDVTNFDAGGAVIGGYQYRKK